MRADAEQVNAPFVGPALHGADARDAIDGKDGRSCGDDPADRLDRMAGSRRCLAQRAHHADRVGMLPQRQGDLIGVNRLPPLGLENHRVDSMSLADTPPARREVACAQDQRLAPRRHRVDRRGLHGTRS